MAFVFDQVELESEAVAALKEGAPDLHAAVVLGELRFFAELDDDRVPVVTVTDLDGRALGRLWLDWRRVGRLS